MKSKNNSYGGKTLIGLAGPAGSGKDTAGDILNEFTGATTYALASPIKKTVNSLFGWNDRHAYGDLKEVDDANFGFSPRRAYQLFGTEFGRALDEDLWLNLAKMEFQRSMNGIIVTDIRFNNEAEWIRSNDGVVIHIEREDNAGVEGHSSEAGINRLEQDIVIDNNGTLESLKRSLKEHF